MESLGRMPAEWEAHDATWIAWPFLEDDFPGKVQAVQWCYCEIVRILAESERVEIICADESVRECARHMLEECAQDFSRVRFHILPIDRTWLRDSAPTAIRTTGGGIAWVQWKFNGWAKYDNHTLDSQVPRLVSEVSQIERIAALRHDTGEAFVIEGGAIDTDGEGTLLVTEECLLSSIQERNPGYTREKYEETFRRYLGIEKTIWLGRGCVGDDTHGHIDDIARFVAPGKVVVAVPGDSSDPQFPVLEENYQRLLAATDAKGRKLEVIKLPMPRDMFYQGDQLPASYANFYIANTRVIVPTFNDPADVEALQILRSAFPDREVVGISARDLVVGWGTLHCLTQQQPR